MKEIGVDELKELLDSYDEAYYNLDAPVITDREYDAIKQRYLALVMGEETHVGGGVSDKFRKVPHLEPILSLEKVKDKGTLAKKIREFKCGAIQPKLDGLTIVVYGENTLDSEPIYSTRGSGSRGENISDTASLVPGLLPIKNIAYRAEVFMPKAEFEKLNKERIANNEEPFSNPRNAAAGMLRQLDKSKVKGLTYMAYNILNTTMSEEDQLKLLKLHGIKTVPTKFFDDNDKSRANAVDWIINFSKEARDNLPYEIDGMVIKSNLPDARAIFGETGHHPKSAIAYKYPTEVVWTTLREVIWQLGKLGNVTPVAVFDPVSILGSVVSRATLHNMDYIRALGLNLDRRIAVTKANEIIPKVIQVEDIQKNSIYKGISEPTHCPICYSVLESKGANLYCRNIMCEGMIIAQIEHMSKALEIDGLSTKTITKMFDNGYLNSKTDIFHVTVDQIQALEGYAKLSAEKLYSSIQGARKNVPFHKFLYACGIPLLGRTASKAIAKTFIPLGTDSHTPLQQISIDINFFKGDKLRAIDGIGEALVNNIAHNIETLNVMKKYIDVDFENNMVTHTPMKQLTFVITGALYRGTRDAYKEKIESLGHKLSGSVSKKTDYLVTNETTQTTKRQKAEDLGVSIIDEEALIKLLIN